MRHTRKFLVATLPIAFLALWVSGCGTTTTAESSGDPHVSAPAYVPPAAKWDTRKPEELGFDGKLLAEAVEFAKQHGSNWDFANQTRIFGSLLGPLPSAHASTNGIIIRHGYIVAEFGDTNAVDPTYSAAKSYLSTIAGVAVDHGLIPDIDQAVGSLVHDGGYESPHNAKVTWRHHLTQTSEWEGEMFGKPSTFIGREKFGEAEMKPRAIREPGSFYEYNDVRVNRFALSMLRVWKRPLPEVLKAEIMDPIGASATWKYVPYSAEGAMVDVDGVKMPTVSGGTRWGGGLWISSRDHARLGLLMLRRGQWGDRRVLSEQWIDQATRPQGVRKDYGFLWWLNTDGRWPQAPSSCFSAQGAGDNTVWIDPEHDLVVVWRWHRGDAQAEFYKRIIEAIRDR